jgi:hypothetical protein
MSNYDKQVFEEMVESFAAELTESVSPVMQSLDEREADPNRSGAAAAAMCTVAASFIAACFSPDFGESESRKLVYETMAIELCKQFEAVTGKVASETMMAILRSSLMEGFDPENN